MEHEMKILINDGRNIFKACKKSFWIVIVMSIVGFIIGCGATIYPNTNLYSATTTVYSYSIYGTELKAISQLIKTSHLCEKAAELINDDNISGYEIQQMIDIQYETDSLILSIGAHSESGDKAVMVVNAVANAFVTEINNQLGNNTLSVLDRARGAYEYYDGVHQQWIIRAAFFMIFGIITLVIIAVKSLVTKEILVTEDFSCGGRLQILGVIPKYHIN